MALAKAKLSNHRQSPRKVRLVADSIRGKSVKDALDMLTYMPKKAAVPVKKLIASAVANAKALSIPTENLKVKEIKVDSGPTLYRRMPRARGTAYSIRKRTSHVSVTLEEVLK